MLPRLPDHQRLARSARRAGQLLRRTDLAPVERRVWDEYEALQERREKRRQRRSHASPQPRCAVCHCFKTNPTAPCSHCGFDPLVGWAG